MWALGQAVPQSGQTLTRLRLGGPEYMGMGFLENKDSLVDEAIFPLVTPLPPGISPVAEMTATLWTLLKNEQLPQAVGGPKVSCGHLGLDSQPH